MAKAICALESTCRWAVTGTPIQNHLNDLATLLKFIRAYPYDTRSRFEHDISNYWKEGRDKEAAARLQRLSSCLLLRQPKATVQLPPRHNKECPVAFTPLEREGYNWLKNRTATAIDEALQQGHRLGRSGAYANILQKIESLRLFCGLGLHYHSRHDEGSLASHTPTSWAAIAQQIFKMHLEMGSIQCSQCHAIIDLTQSLFDDSTTQNPQFSRCLKFACAECSAKLARQGIMMDCGHSPSCSATQVSTSIDTIEDVPDEHVPIARHPSELPSKIAALISDIISQPAHVKS
jgi:SNF2 family DNA or RNA helicase